MSIKTTHTLRSKPRISARYLADFMAASDTARRTIVRDSKYAPNARVIQHTKARGTIAKFIRDEDDDLEWLGEEEQALRDKLADDQFDRDLFDHNADYIGRFAKTWPKMSMPKAQVLGVGASPPLMLNGVTISFDIIFRLRRLTKTNKVKVGAGMLRYGKGETLPPAVGAWQSALIFGYLMSTEAGQQAEPEHPLCLTLDVWGGVIHAAPTDSVRRYNLMKSACATISEWWPNVKPPAGATF